jgi:hypothetical protein
MKVINVVKAPRVLTNAQARAIRRLLAVSKAIRAHMENGTDIPLSHVHCLSEAIDMADHMKIVADEVRVVNG